MPYDPHNDPVLRAMLAEVRLLLPEFQHAYDAELRMKLHTLSRSIGERIQQQCDMHGWDLYNMKSDGFERNGAQPSLVS
jgi:hypothetical protein